jgi:hypothetical protein
LFAVTTVLFGCCLAPAQVPTGSISGSVADETGALIPGAKVTVRNPETGLVRELTTGNEGGFMAASLNAGSYDVKVEASGFKALVSQVVVTAGGTSTVTLKMQLGESKEQVTVEGVAPQIEYESHAISGVVTRQEIESLPLNGRSFLQLAFLEPGVTVSTASTSQFNHQFNVSVMGGDPGQTRITVDGVNIVDGIDGGSQQNFSQEVVQEFQISTTNFDLATSVTGVGALNIVTRTGGNSFHGSGYFFFRDHNMAAYPGLSRDPAAPDPFFARRQSGFYLGGPIKKDRLWFFANLEHLNQRGVVAVQPLEPSFSTLGVVYPSPYIGNQISARLDYRINSNNNAFLRYSHDGNHSFGPTAQGSLPSNWLQNINWADQAVASVTSIVRANVVNEARFAYSYWHNRNLLPDTQVCPGNCMGLLEPQIDIIGAGLTLGNNVNAPQGRDLRHFTTGDYLTWVKGSHRWKFGGEWEYEYGGGFWAQQEPAAMEVYSPQAVATYNAQLPPNAARIPIPSSFQNLNDLLQLPLAYFSTGVGDPTQPPFYNYGKANHSHRIHAFAQDTWHIAPRFTLNYGLAYTYETNLLNHDLTKPQILEPIFGANGLGAEQHDPHEISPSLGFAWSPGHDGKTVIRGGAGIYYQTFLVVNRLTERTYLDPLGDGHPVIPSSDLPNPVPGVPGVGLGTALYFPNNPTAFTAGDLLPALPGIRAQIQQMLGNPDNTNLAIRNVDLFKTADQLLPSHYPLPYSEHFSAGVQRELTHDMVLDVNLLFKQFIRTDVGSIDLNHYNSVEGPLIPQCVGIEVLIPTAHCSNGPVGVRLPIGRSHYKGLLVKLNKRYAKRTMLQVSYALQSEVGLSQVINNNDWFQGWGQLAPRHVLNVSGIVDLPWGLQASFISQVTSRSPFSVNISGLDLNGDGTTNDILPGTNVGEFNFGGGKGDLIRQVDQFNQQYAGKVTPLGVPIPRIVLPANFNFGDSFSSQDLRLGRTFRYREHWKLNVFGEVFNLLNIANLSGYSGNLRETSLFGQPTSRVDQVFGSGGPRAFQLGARLTF